MKIKFLTGLIVFFFACELSGQVSDYKYRRKISGVSDTWHKIELPTDIFNNVKSDLTDIRIYGFTNQDTIEAPFILKEHIDKIENNTIRFSTINRVKSGKTNSLTFYIEEEQPVNQIKLNFSRKNYELTVKLEGSHNQAEWFEITDNYRLVAISNDLVEYEFSTLSFPNTKFKYIRTSWVSQPKTKLISAYVKKRELFRGESELYPCNFKASENRKDKQTILDITLKETVPVSFIKINTENKFDYYRPISILKKTDSIKTVEGWKNVFLDIKTSVLSSVEEPEFHFPKQFTNKLRVIIHNHDNEPLSITSIETGGYKHSLEVRFTTPANIICTMEINGPENLIMILDILIPKFPIH